MQSGYRIIMESMHLLWWMHPIDNIGCNFMTEDFKVPNTRWTWENLTGNIQCDQRKCLIRINLPKVKKENIAYEVTKETFCIKSSNNGNSFQDNFSCWIFAQRQDYAVHEYGHRFVYLAHYRLNRYE